MVIGRAPAGATSGSLAPLFETREIFEEGGSGYTTADFDLDGDLDVLMEDGFRWLEHGPGDPPTFVAHDLESPQFDLNAQEVLAVDLSGDGRPDVVATFFDAASIEWSRNLGGSPPAFERRTLYREVGWRPWRIDAGDIDGDGDIDLLSWRSDLDGVGPERQRLAWHENQGAQFVIHEIYESESSVGLAQIEPGVADLDGDGDNDVLAGDCATSRTLWFESDGSLPPTFNQHVLDPTAGALDFAFGDLDLDGDRDVIGGFVLSPRIYENLGGEPSVFAVHELSVEGQSPRFGDLNADGQGDIVLSPGGTVGLRWLENVGSLMFIVHDARGVDEIVANGGSLSDLEGNGSLDLVTSNGSGSASTIRVEALHTVGAWSFGIAPSGVICRNLSTGQTVREAAPVGSTYDCQALGLDVDPGDRVQITVRGVVE
jgi:hypothetical protein